LGVADDGEVLEVELGLLHEALTIRSRHGREWALTHCGGTRAKALQHRVDVELVGHDANLPRSRAPRDERAVASGEIGAHRDLDVEPSGWAKSTAVSA
jgi:hypothetical protein